jgi:hypothetical protein
MTNEPIPESQGYLNKIPVIIPQTTCYPANMPLSDYKLLLESLFEKFEKKHPIENKIF